MAYIHIDFENPGHKIETQNKLREAYKNIPHRFESNTKSSITIIADSSVRQDRRDIISKRR